MPPPSPLRLCLSGDALVANWRWLAAQGGPAACGAAIKANGYGLGARGVMDRLAAAGCRDFFVATWNEALALAPLPAGVTLSVLHGLREEDMALARSIPGARPTLCTPQQVARWHAAGGGACDVMIDTGMSRLGLDYRTDLAAIPADLPITTLMSHLACADEDHPLNAVQRDRFAAVCARIRADRYSLSNSAGILLGLDYALDLTRPGVALYGGVQRPQAEGHIAQVVFPQAQVIQRRRIRAGDTVGYSATFAATADMELAVLNIGYADGYLRGFSGRGFVVAGGVRLPVLGRVSMDLLIVDATAAPDVGEGDWIDIGYDLREAAAQSGLSQYELLTGMGARYDRVWV